MRDSQGNVLALYEGKASGLHVAPETIVLQETIIYGSSRIGQYRGFKNDAAQGEFNKKTALGQRIYEFSNHLGNVLVTLTDHKLPQAEGGYKSFVLSASDYYPFGMAMTERAYQNGEYRFGFNGKENDGDFGSSIQDYGFRLYAPSIAKFLSVDPLTKKYPELTPYQFASNTPIQAIDLDGLEAYFNTSGQFVKWGEDKSDNAPVILLVNDVDIKKASDIEKVKEITIDLTIKEFENRVYWITGEGGKKGSRTSRYYAHTIKNAKKYGYHGKGFTEEKMTDVLWKSKSYKKKDFLEGLPTVTDKTNPYKVAYKVKSDYKNWNEDMNWNAQEILLAEAGLTSDPTRGATNWGGGKGSYDLQVKELGSDNVIKLEEDGFIHVFMNLNTGELIQTEEQKENKEFRKKKQQDRKSRYEAGR